MGNILKELREVIGDDYDFRIEINSIGFNVIFSKEMLEDLEITVTYGFEEFPYVNFEYLDKDLKEKEQTLTTFDYGFDIDDIKIIYKIMMWMEDNGDNLNKCMFYCGK